MAEWIYKTTVAKASMNVTLGFLRQDGFLARTKFLPGTLHRAPLASEVEIGDLIHVYYVYGGRPNTLGSFVILDPDGAGPAFSSAFEDEAFAQVRDRQLQDRLKPFYGVDPVKRAFVGWALKRSSVVTPKYDPQAFPGMHTLRKWPME